MEDNNVDGYPMCNHDPDVSCGVCGEICYNCSIDLDCMGEFVYVELGQVFCSAFCQQSYHHHLANPSFPDPNEVPK